MYTIAVFVGSLRKESFNKKLAEALALVGKDIFRFNIVPLDDVPMYNQDMEANFPAPVVRIKKAVAEADGVLLVTPEYNRSIPSVLKNSMDWCSRPYGENSWAGKPAALAGTSPGAVGTAAVQSHLRSVMAILGMIVMGQPEMYLIWNDDYFDAAGHVADEKNKDFLRQFLVRFSKWIELHGHKR